MRTRNMVCLTVAIMSLSRLFGATLSITKGGTGDGHLKVNGVNKTLPFSQSYAAGTGMTVEAVPETGSRFDDWSGSGLTGTMNPVSFVMPAVDISASANFTLQVPDIHCDASALNFGSIPAHASAMGNFLIGNNGQVNLSVSQLSIINGDNSDFVIIAGGEAFTLAPGSAHYTEVWFVPTRSGIKNAYLRISSNDPDESPIDIVLSGNCLAPDIGCSVEEWNFGSFDVGSTAVISFVITNTGNINLNVSSTAITGANASEFSFGGPGSYSLAPGATYTMMVRFSPRSAGGKEALLQFASNDPVDNPLNIPLYGNAVSPGGMMPDISTETPAKNFEPVYMGGYRDETLFIGNHGSADLTVSATEILGTHASDFIVRNGGGAFTLAPGGDREITVRFAPTGEGDRNASLKIVSNDPDENPFYILLSGQGRISTQSIPDIEISPASLNAADSGTLDLVIKNTGNSDLTFDVVENNLLKNGGFESGFTPWIEEDYVNAGLIIQDNSQHHSGNHSAKSTGDHLVNYWELQLKQCGFQVTDGQAYAVSFWGKTQKARTVSVGLCRETADWNDISERHTASLTASWQYFSYTLHVNIPAGVPNPLPPADTRFFFSNIGTDLTAFWIDDVKLQTTATASGWLCCGSASGTIAPGSQNTLKISFNPGNLANGTYQANLVIQSNDPDEPSITVPVTMTVNTSSIENPGDRSIPCVQTLHQNYPNPFNPATTIQYSLPHSSDVRLAVNDALGREVAVLAEGRQPAGEHRVVFSGQSFESGMYFCRLEADSRLFTMKMLLLK